MSSLGWPCWIAQAQISTAPEASKPGYELSWQAPTGCPSQSEVSGEILDLTAAAGNAHATPVVATARVVADREGFTLGLTLRDGGVERTRRLGAPTCEELAHATALIVAIAVDPALLERHDLTHGSGEFGGKRAEKPYASHCRIVDLAPSQLPAPPPLFIERSCAPRVVAAQAHTQVSEASREWPYWQLGLGLYGVYQTLPGANLGVGALAGIQGERVRMDITLSMMATTVQAQTPGRSADLRLYRVAPRASWLWLKGNRFAAGPSASVEVGLLTGKGYGGDLTVFDWKYAPWLASSAGTLVEGRLSPNSLLLLSAEMVIPLLLSDGFVMAGETIQKTRVSGAFGIGFLAAWH